MMKKQRLVQHFRIAAMVVACCAATMPAAAPAEGLETDLPEYGIAGRNGCIILPPLTPSPKRSAHYFGHAGFALSE